MEYFFPEQDLFVDSVFVTKNGIQSEQTLEVLVQPSFSGFSQEGNCTCAVKITFLKFLSVSNSIGMTITRTFVL